MYCTYALPGLQRQFLDSYSPRDEQCTADRPPYIHDFLSSYQLTCMESALIISPLNLLAISRASFDFPVPVAPKTTTTGTRVARTLFTNTEAMLTETADCTTRVPLSVYYLILT